MELAEKEKYLQEAKEKAAEEEEQVHEEAPIKSKIPEDNVDDFFVR